MLGPHPPAMADVVARVYGGTPWNKLATTFPRSTVEAHVKRLRERNLAPDGVEGAPTLQVFRAVLQHYGYKDKSAARYTDYEAQQALFQASTGKLSYPDVESIYGVPSATLRRKLDDACSALGYASNKDMQADKSEVGIQRIKAHSLNAGHTKRGPQPFLSTEEVYLVSEVQHAMNESGGCVTSKMMSTALREMVRAKGAEALLHAKTDPEKKRALKMAGAVVSRPYTERQIKLAEGELGVDGTADSIIANLPSAPVAVAANQKPSKKMRTSHYQRFSCKSAKRVKAGTVLLDIEMRKRMEVMYDKILGVGIRPGR